MKRYLVRLMPSAQAQLRAIQDYIAENANPEIAERYIEAILARCEALEHFPYRGSPRDDLRPGIRVLIFRRSVTIAYSVDEDVAVLGIFSKGQNVEALLRDADIDS